MVYTNLCETWNTENILLDFWNNEWQQRRQRSPSVDEVTGNNVENVGLIANNYNKNLFFFMGTVWKII